MKFGVLFEKLPKAFLGGLLGITLGFIGGTIFMNMGAVPELMWDKILIFLGAIFGFVAGYQDGEE